MNELRRLIGRNLVASTHFSFSGFVIGINFTLFHLAGNTPLFKHSLYKAVIHAVKFQNYLYISRPLFSLLLWLFLFLVVPTAFLISSVMNSLSSAVFTGTWVCSVACVWY
jgi:hypothetical protein